MLSHNDKKILKNQIRHTLELIENLEEKTGLIHLEKEIKHFFKERKFLGSRDRRFINNHVYAFFRWKGWVIKFESIDMLFITSLLDTCFTEKSFAFFIEHPKTSITEEQAKEFSEFSIQKKADFLAEHYKHPFTLENLIPSWLVSQIQTNDLAQFIDANSKRALMWVRLQRTNKSQFLKINPLQVIESPEHLPKCLAFEANSSLDTLDSYKSGYFEIQDLGSQLITEICSPSSS